MDDIQGTYGIGYADVNGMGFSDFEPWISTGFDTVAECKNRVTELINEGYKRVTPFKIDDELPESYTWDYVEQHRI